MVLLVGLVLKAVGFDNSTRIYLAEGELFGGERFMKPFRVLFPCLENHNSVDTSDRKELTPILIDRVKGKNAGFEEAVRRAMLGRNFGGPHKRNHSESFYTNSWPKCFCQMSPPPANQADKCPPDNVLEILDSQMENEDTDDLDTPRSSNSTSVT
ncbi:hypothetical protein QQ045_006383 [Rhodiola kirilowii]